MSGPRGSTRASALLLAGRYELVHHIARGGMADVFEAIDRQLDRQVAVKRFRAASPQDRSRFEAEVLVLARLNHPHLVQVYDAGEHDGDSFVVMELVDGPSLQRVLETRVVLPADEVAALGSAVADALAYVHEQGIVHRDVTPANVLCGRDGRARLADFGIARLIDTSRITATATTIGTAAYMAPEQLQGHDVTPAADVYSLGLVLLESLAGRSGFEGTSAEVAVARLARDPDTATGLPDPWAELLTAMTARDPAARPRAATVRGRLRALAMAAAPDAAPPSVAGAAGEGAAAEVGPTSSRPARAGGPAASAVAGAAVATMPSQTRADEPTIALDSDRDAPADTVAVRPADGDRGAPTAGMGPTQGRGTEEPIDPRHGAVGGATVHDDGPAAEPTAPGHGAADEPTVVVGGAAADGPTVAVHGATSEPSVQLDEAGHEPTAPGHGAADEPTDLDGGAAADGPAVAVHGATGEPSVRLDEAGDEPTVPLRGATGGTTVTVEPTVVVGGAAADVPTVAIHGATGEPSVRLDEAGEEPTVPLWGAAGGATVPVQAGDEPTVVVGGVAADVPTVPTARAGGDGAPAGEQHAAGAVDGFAETQAIPVPSAAPGTPAGGGTTVMPAVMRPEAMADAPSRRRGRPAVAARPRHLVWGLIAGLLAAALIGAIAGSGGGIDVPSTTTVTAAPPSTTTTVAPTTTAAPAPAAAPAPPDGGQGEAKGKGKGNGNGKTGDD